MNILDVARALGNSRIGNALHGDRIVETVNKRYGNDQLLLPSMTGVDIKVMFQRLSNIEQTKLLNINTMTVSHTLEFIASVHGPGLQGGKVVAVKTPLGKIALYVIFMGGLIFCGFVTGNYIHTASMMNIPVHSDLYTSLLTQLAQLFKTSNKPS